MEKVKVSDILSNSIETYRLDRKLSWKQEKVLNKIINCSTEQMELQQITCTKNDCNYSQTRRRPCRDRHCNRCNQSKKLKWMKKMMTDFLSVPYHHVVFTLPEELRNLTICNQALLYDIFLSRVLMFSISLGKIENTLEEKLDLLDCFILGAKP
ncbi:MAG: transposase zinc-binding domain-containing protein [Ignavibacteriales bacterium]|nr:transposase zinc-binding domain-containing protein [Ignavibacteriales bacterium]